MTFFAPRWKWFRLSSGLGKGEGGRVAVFGGFVYSEFKNYKNINKRVKEGELQSLVGSLHPVTIQCHWCPLEFWNVPHPVDLESLWSPFQRYPRLQVRHVQWGRLHRCHRCAKVGCHGSGIILVLSSRWDNLVGIILIWDHLGGIMWERINLVDNAKAFCFRCGVDKYFYRYSQELYCIPTKTGQ